MSTLNDLQENFYKNLFLDNKNLNFIKSDCKHARFEVYKNTIFTTLVSALKITYPGVWSLIGEECANAMGRRFLRDQINFPSSGCLDDWGSDFPKFLGKQKDLQKLRYISDYAKFEWLYFLSKMSPSELTVAQDCFLNYTEEELLNLNIKFKSSCYLIKSNYDLLAINKIINEHDINKSTNLSLSDCSVLADATVVSVTGINNNTKQESTHFKKQIKYSNDTNKSNLLANRSYLLIIKHKNTPEILSVNADLWCFLSYIYNNETLGTAVALTSEMYQNFDLINSLTFMISKKIVTQLQV